MAQPLSGRLQTSLRFLPPPLPAAPSASLTSRFPLRGDDGLTTFRRCARVGRSQLFAGGASSAPRDCGDRGPDHRPFGSSVSASCACCQLRRLTLLHGKLTRPADPAPDRRVMLAVVASARASATLLSGRGYIVPGASHPSVTRGACPGGILLAEQQVLSVCPSTAAQLQQRPRVALSVAL